MPKGQRPPSWQGMTRFTRGLLFFLAGTVAFFLREYFGGTAGKLLLVAAIGLFLVGFVVASQGIGRQWQEMGGGEDRDE